MKIQCDVCEKGEAAVYCTADEAALCNSCDHRVHHANKLASKHQRFSLIQPPPKQAPICDICQDRRAFLFCQQDRAILCRECDIPIHKANEHTGKHNRFLLTGVKLSASSSLYSSSTSSPSSSSSKSETAAISTNSDAVPRRNNKLSVSVTNNNPSTVTKADSKAASLGLTNTVTGASTGLVSDNGQMMNGVGDGNGNSNTSSIAEYLIETLPGWHVEEFFDSSSSSPFGFCKVCKKKFILSFFTIFQQVQSRGLFFTNFLPLFFSLLGTEYE
ncbi:OLC1v1018127C2 [Oldenlandia corymbosa var. corymbosa]|uniref:OLC1v1018127C2 n=1 Tax=Oldenlandia corymbosa var. corymbosa TaxID=529605 RepID=A0AAV1EAY5_OLDCO|nr:OLC1v1018127C2 [Oldenlandia corymbosa var. corymbosa]